LEMQTIDGVEYVTFQPNTIVYAVPAASPAGKKISGSQIGVVFHTTYTGDSYESLQASFGVDLGYLSPSNRVWYQTANIPNLAGSATLTKDETAAVSETLSNAGKIFQKISGTALKQLEETPELAQTLETYNNIFVRKGEAIPDSKKHVEGLIKWMTDKFAAERDTKKTEKGKAAVTERETAFMKFFSPSNKEALVLIYELQKALVRAKNIIIKKLDALKSVKTFIRTRNGFKVTGQEGFVAIDRLTNGAVKLVDRLEFSTNNFSPDVIKGWDR
jgi:hypothetical protein